MGDVNGEGIEGKGVKKKCAGVLQGEEWGEGRIEGERV